MALSVKSRVRKPAVATSPELEDAKRRSEEMGASIREARERGFAEFKEAEKNEQASSGRTRTAHTPKAPDAAPSVINRPEYLVVKLQGRDFVIGPPKGVSINIAMLRMFEGLNFSGNEARIAKATLYVREMDGKKVDIPVNLFDRDLLVTQIGDGPLAGVLALADEYWPALQVSELVVVEKKYT